MPMPAGVAMGGLPPANIGLLRGLESCIAEIGVAVIEVDLLGRVVQLNAIAERITGWSQAEARRESVDRVFRLVPPQPSTSETLQEIELAALQRPPDSDPSRARDPSVFAPDRTALLKRRDGTIVPLRHVVGPSLPAAGGARLIVFRDLSAEQLMSLQLARRARYDTLTGLLNRRALEDRVDRAVADSRKTGSRHGLCYFDLDRFRLINLTCGHSAGDDLLQFVASRIHEVLGANDAAARIGGDEFALLLTDRDPGEVEKVVRTLQKRLLDFRFGWEDKTFTVAASFGLVCFGKEAGGAADLLSAADDACRKAKEMGRGRLHVLAQDDEDVKHSRRSMQWVAGLQRNLAEGRLRLFAQGIHPLHPGTPPAEVTGKTLAPGVATHYEILVRQVGDDGQLHSPVRIIQAAENIGLMDAIDRFVVRQALRAVGALPPRALRRLEVCSINLSGVSLLREGLLDYIVDELGRANVPPSKICFEITETAALANLGEVLWLMQELGAMGCRFAIDDFGSGHASYGYIERLPVHHVKIDGSFVRDVIDNPLHRAIVESVYIIGKTLKIKTVAEAVETREIADALAGIGIDYAQGWLFSRPRPLAQVFADLE
jgi:diguanylate cyclase (GGDEF)-like protein